MRVVDLLGRIVLVTLPVPHPVPEFLRLSGTHGRTPWDILMPPAPRRQENASLCGGPGTSWDRSLRDHLPEPHRRRWGGTSGR